MGGESIEMMADRQHQGSAHETVLGKGFHAPSKAIWKERRERFLEGVGRSKENDHGGQILIAQPIYDKNYNLFVTV